MDVYRYGWSWLTKAMMAAADNERTERQAYITDTRVAHHADENLLRDYLAGLDARPGPKEKPKMAS